MDPSSVEDYERAVVNGLQVVLQPTLTAIEAKYLDQDRQDGLAEPDGTTWVKLDAPRRTDGGASGFGDYYPGGTDIVTAWPSIEVAVPDLLAAEFDIAQRDADTETRLVIMVWLKDARFPVLNRMQKRYSAAVFDCLKVPGVLGHSKIREARFAWRTDPENKDSDQRIEAGGLIYLLLEDSLIR